MQDRVKQIDGAVNLRDFGGYATAEGYVQRDKLFRCGTLHYLTEAGQAQFHDLGVELICDLRRAEEKAGEPTNLPPENPRRLEIPLDPGSAVELRTRMADAQVNLEDRINFMIGMTHELVRDHADDYARMFTELMDLQDGGFLVHCSAGKDRTGVACALILHALGVPQQTVVEDYLLTNEATDYEGFVFPLILDKYEAGQPPDRATIMALAGVRPEYIASAYAAIAADFDSVEHYIRDALKLSAADLANLRQRYVTNAAVA
ncbi:MAG: tyrosine-protein phosphatase [Pseudomonadota bacterium]